MGLVHDIVESWRAPGPVLARHSADRDEARAFALLLAGCALLFVAQWPVAMRAAHLDPSVPFDARLGGALFGWLFLAPLLAYGLAALAHGVARLSGGRGTAHEARLALFWAILASAPLWLVNGLVAGLVGAGPIFVATQLAALGLFAWVWIRGFVRLQQER